MRDGAGITQTLALEIQNSLITALYLVRNPDKPRHVRRPIENLRPGETCIRCSRRLRCATLIPSFHEPTDRPGI